MDRYCISALSVEVKQSSRIPEVCLYTACNRGLLSLLGDVAACGATYPSQTEKHGRGKIGTKSTVGRDRRKGCHINLFFGYVFLVFLFGFFSPKN